MQKLGLIYEPDKSLPWQQTHVQNPFPVQLSEHVFRIFFASRDAQNVSRTGYFDLDMRDPLAPKNRCAEPVLDIGELGAFDDCGAMPHSIVKIGQQYVMYTTGWSKAVTVPFSFHIGIATSPTLDGPFQRYSKAPVIGRNHYDPFIAGAPYTIEVEGGYLMFYVSCLKWDAEGGAKAKHYYTIKTAESKDGYFWEPNPEITIELEDDEYAIARPVIYKGKDEYELWFSFRGGDNPYSIGHATSKDLRTWTRSREVIGPTGTGWDSEMMCYAAPFDYQGRKYMLYNGNAYGRDGCGLAVL